MPRSKNAICTIAALVGLPMALTGSALAASSASQMGQCAPDTSATAGRLRDNIASLVSDTDSISAEYRTAWGVPQLSASAVTIVSDTAQCRIGAGTYAGAVGAADSSFRVFLFKVDIRRIVVPEPVSAAADTTGALTGAVTDSTYGTVIELVDL